VGGSSWAAQGGRREGGATASAGRHEMGGAVHEGGE
jgi:hypothetical protein